MPDQGNAIQSATIAVGIGASAGGVEALSLFFDHERGASHAAFLVVMHLSATRSSHLSDILARHTGMPVLKAEDGMPIEPDKVYVMPPGTLMTVTDGHLQIKANDLAEHAPSVIDRFFNSLAEQFGDHAIGIVLSGTGTDGALGLKAIKDRGGLTIAQGEDGTAPLFAGMPESAVAAGAIDIQLSVEEIGPRLATAIADMRRSDESAAGQGGERSERLRLEIATLLHDQVNHDFSGYKPSTFLRRVQRRMNVLQLANLEAYVDYLKNTPVEATLLFRDLLIGVTSFFRDADSFLAVETEVIPALFKHKEATEEVRVWVPGCATGEEAYSLAILLLEYAEGLGGNAPAVRVFATDIDERALGIARRGRYPRVLLDAMTQERRRTFFIEDSESYSVQRRLRQVCTFSPHNVLRDPPFSRIDLVSCRNLLIYLGSEFQAQILPILHYALRPDGFLFVGVAESVTRRSDLFTPHDKSHHIFRPLPDAPGAVQLPMLTGHSQRRSEASLSIPTGRVSSKAVRRQIEARILQAHAPPYVLVNAQGDVLFYSGRTGPYLEFSPGPPSRHLLSNARKELRLGLRRTLHEAVATQAQAILPVVVLPLAHGPRRVQISIEPFDDSDAALFLVLFNDQGPPPEPAVDTGDGDALRTEQMARELLEAREQLQSTYEEFETALEELRVANEELMSVNEELQSSNEELETSKEELQSVNEELQTVNTEMSRNMEALDQSNADLRGLLDSTGIATIFLDRDLTIRRYTQPATELFTLIPSDCGRRITDLKHQLADLDLDTLLREAQINLHPVQRPVTRQDRRRHYLMCLLPYKGASEETGGIVMTFVDVTPMAEATAQQKIMIGELNHRVRNMLAVINALTMQTLAPVVEEKVLEPFLGRLRAMARTYKLLTESNWSHMSLRGLLREELSVASGSAQFVTEGPEVLLSPREALGLGLVLHELATNALKYGALSQAGGQLTVEWTCDPDDGAVSLSWTEAGGPAVEAPSHRGFGTRLIERQLSYELDGKTELDFAPGGLTVKLHMPRLQTEKSTS